MSIVRSIINILVDRMVPAIGSLLVSRLETIVTIEEADQQNELEDKARQLETDGKPQLAAALRTKAALITLESPGARGLSIVRNLQQQSQEAEEGFRLLEGPRLATESELPANRLAIEQAQPKRPRRPVAHE
jgi:hypothetical protein